MAELWKQPEKENTLSKISPRLVDWFNLPNGKKNPNQLTTTVVHLPSLYHWISTVCRGETGGSDLQGMARWGGAWGAQGKHLKRVMRGLH